MTTFVNEDLRQTPSEPTLHRRNKSSILQPPFDREARIKGVENQPASKSALEDDTLPATFYDKESSSFESPEKDVTRFLVSDIYPSRLESIHHRLWLTGRPSHAYSLHQQHMIGRTVVTTDEADLHLAWTQLRIFLKVFPRYLCDYEFWTNHLCKDEALHAAACGFVLSYTWLVRSELDFSFAKKLNLLPDGTWIEWRSFFRSARAHFAANPPGMIHRRYIYSELRLGRLNWIMRLDPHASRRDGRRRSLFDDDHTYASFFQKNFAWTVIVFLYVTLALTSMQVGLAVDRLKGNDSFQSACYGFAIFCLVLPIAITFSAGIIFVCLFVYNFGKTQRNRLRRRRMDSRI